MQEAYRELRTISFEKAYGSRRFEESYCGGSRIGWVCFRRLKSGDLILKCKPVPSATAAGLTTEEARQRFLKFGANDPVSSRRTSGLTQILFLFINPLAIILLIASGISAAVGEVLNASIIALMVLLSAALNFFQTYRSQRAVERIRKEVAPAANVLRDGNWTAIPRRELVPGDVIGLTAGDLVPADAWLFKARDLHVQQAALTGESLPVEKDAVDLQAISQGTSDQHKVFLGTSVVSGSGTALVTATGRNTVLRRYCHSPRHQAAGNGVRKRHPTVWSLDHEDDHVARALRSAGERSPSSQFSRVSTFRRRPGGRPDTRVPADDNDRNPGAGRGAYGTEESDRQASRGDAKLWQHRCSMQRQDRNTYQRRDGPGPTRRSIWQSV